MTAGQPFFFSLVGFLESPSGLVTAINSNPSVNWIQLDRVAKSIGGQVPIDYPAGPVAVTVTTQYNIGVRNVDKRDFESQFVIVLNVFLPASTTTPGSFATPTALTTVSHGSTSGSPSPTPASSQTTLSTTPMVTQASTFMSISSFSPSTTASTSGVPVPTLTARQSFSIDLSPYLRLPDDTVLSITTSPIYEWIYLQSIRQAGGFVPASQPQGTVDITLTIQTTNERTYTVTFTALIVPYTEPSPAPTSTSTDDLSSTTTPTSTTQTRPTAFPTPTIYQGQSFTIGKDPYQWALGDILNGVSSDPPADWFKLVLPPLFRPSGITGVVPADWPPGPINVTLNMYSRSPSMQYFVSFIVIVMESPPVSSTSAISTTSAIYVYL